MQTDASQPDSVEPKGKGEHGPLIYANSRRRVYRARPVPKRPPNATPSELERCNLEMRWWLEDAVKHATPYQRPRLEKMLVRFDLLTGGRYKPWRRRIPALIGAILIGAGFIALSFARA